MAVVFFLIIYVGACYLLLQILFVIGDKVSHLTGADEGFAPSIKQKIDELGKKEEL